MRLNVKAQPTSIITFSFVEREDEFSMDAVESQAKARCGARRDTEKPF
jgi:hypothetical protein